MKPSAKSSLPTTEPERQALEMLDAFASVGASRFDLTVTDLAGKRIDDRCDCSMEQLSEHIGLMLRTSTARRRNLIVRPKAAQALLIQLDDLDAAVVQTVQAATFLILCTSPGNYQAWIAASDGDKDFTRRLKKEVGSDPSASGATRISGSLNCKAKYAPSFPRVENVHVALGRIVRKADLEALGVVAAPMPTAILPPPPPCFPSTGRTSTVPGLPEKPAGRSQAERRRRAGSEQSRLLLVLPVGKVGLDGGSDCRRIDAC